MTCRSIGRLSVLLLLLLGLVLYVAGRISAFAQIFLADSRAGIRVTQSAAAAAHANASEDARPQLIPKILHQVFHNWKDPGNDKKLPADWERVRQTCIDKNPDWEYRLWTEKASRDFIETEYAWFLKTYDGYRYKVQRVDAVRYFLLLHYGGIYIDLDNGCLENLDALLYYPMWIPDPGRGALSNNILASRPNHPYWAMLTQSLRAWDYHYLFPYVTISYASGQWLCTDIWERYHALLPPHGDGTGLDHRAHRLVMDDRDQGTGEWIYFSQERGGTWKNWDNRMFLWIGDHLLLFFLGLAALLGGLGWMALRHMPRRIGYSRLL